MKLKQGSPAIDQGYPDDPDERYFFHDFDDKVGPLDGDGLPDENLDFIRNDMGANEHPFLEGSAFWWELF